MINTIEKLDKLKNGSKIILSRNMCVSCMSLKDRYKGDIEIHDTGLFEQIRINQYFDVPFVQYPLLAKKVKGKFQIIEENLKAEYFETEDVEE